MSKLQRVNTLSGKRAQLMDPCTCQKRSKKNESINVTKNNGA